MKRNITPCSERDIRFLLERVSKGTISIDEAVGDLRALPVEELGFASLDHHRTLRKGFPEVVFCQNKTPAQVAEIFIRLASTGQAVLGTRATPAQFRAARRRCRAVKYDELARTLWIDAPRRNPLVPGVVLMSAGTADLPIAEEAARTLDVLGHQPERIYDVGVAGLHRLVRHTRTIQRANVVIVVAGMEGALASVVGGLTSAPVVAVPTSVGYGTSVGGFTALFAMLNSCSPGVAVVNIDNGFGAGYLAASINRRIVGGTTEHVARRATV
ncbi:MAG: nickel pincer cofactor biosynthesis protein LarB [Acidobacteria bacterium]|nr:nickel pincer cofactor biosynthesis protein LarB [Acidobacteriota bacterium]